jgi:hypothetical protein
MSSYFMNSRSELFMRPQRPINEEEKESLNELLRRTKTKADYQRVQCIWLRAVFGMSSDQVGLAVGFSPSTVKKLWSQYFSEGQEVLIGQGRGGRRRANLGLEAEEKLLVDFFDKAKRGEVLVVNEVKAAYEGAEPQKLTSFKKTPRNSRRGG